MTLRILILMLLLLRRLGWLVMLQTRQLLVMWLQLNIDSIVQLDFTKGWWSPHSPSCWIEVWNPFNFQVKSIENYQLSCVPGGISVRVAVIYRLHPTPKKMAWKKADQEGFRDWLTLSLLTVAAICWSKVISIYTRIAKGL